MAANFAGSVFSMGANESRASTAALILSSGIPVTFEISARAAWRTALRKSTGVAFGHLEPKFSPYGPSTHSVYGRAARALRVGSIDDLVADEVTDESGVDQTTLKLEVAAGLPAKAVSMFSAVVEEAPGRAKLSLKVPAKRMAPNPIRTMSTSQAIRARTGWLTAQRLTGHPQIGGANRQLSSDLRRSGYRPANDLIACSSDEPAS